MGVVVVAVLCREEALYSWIGGAPSKLRAPNRTLLLLSGGEEDDARPDDVSSCAALAVSSTSDGSEAGGVDSAQGLEDGAQQDQVEEEA